MQVEELGQARLRGAGVPIGGAWWKAAAALGLAAVLAGCSPGSGAGGSNGGGSGGATSPGFAVQPPSPTQSATPPGSPASPATGVEQTPSPPGQSIDDVRLRLEPVSDGFDSPLQVVSPPDDERLFVVEQTGRIIVLDRGVRHVYLDLTDRVTAGGERGLLSLAFHPHFATNGRLFVHYSGDNGRTVLAELHAADPAADQVEESTAQIVLTHDQPASNHNGGQLTFGPDGMLYLGLGDGGAAGDRFGNGQNPNTLLGTILRLDVDAGMPYAIPADNPFAEHGGGAPEVWQYGLRNPWRFTFDAGQLYIADVGQNAIEEIDVVPADRAGLNFGWPIMEGTTCYQQASCDRSGLVLPVLEYTHEATDGCAVIGGHVYRGQAIPALQGQYFYGDLCAGLVRSARVVDGQVRDEHDWTSQVGRVPQLTSFGVDSHGELYVTQQTGGVSRIVPG